MSRILIRLKIFYIIFENYKILPCGQEKHRKAHQVLLKVPALAYCNKSLNYKIIERANFHKEWEIFHKISSRNLFAGIL